MPSCAIVNKNTMATVRSHHLRFSELTRCASAHNAIHTQEQVFHHIQNSTSLLYRLLYFQIDLSS